MSSDTKRKIQENLKRISDQLLRCQQLSKKSKKKRQYQPKIHTNFIDSKISTSDQNKNQKVQSEALSKTISFPEMPKIQQESNQDFVIEKIADKNIQTEKSPQIHNVNDTQKENQQLKVQNQNLASEISLLRSQIAQKNAQLRDSQQKSKKSQQLTKKLNQKLVQNQQQAQQKFNSLNKKIRQNDDHMIKLGECIVQQQSFSEKLRQELKTKQTKMMQTFNTRFKQIDAQNLLKLNQIRSELDLEKIKSAQLSNRSYILASQYKQICELSQVFKCNYMKIQAKYLLKAAEIYKKDQQIKISKRRQQQYRNYVQKYRQDQEQMNNTIMELISMIQQQFKDLPNLKQQSSCLQKLGDRITLVQRKLAIINQNCSKNHCNSPKMIKSNSDLQQKKQENFFPSKTHSVKLKNMSQQRKTSLVPKKPLSIVNQSEKKQKSSQGSKLKNRKVASQLNLSLQNNAGSQERQSIHQLHQRYTKMQQKYQQLFVQNERLLDYISIIKNKIPNKNNGQNKLKQKSPQSILDKITNKISQIQNKQDCWSELSAIVKELKRYITFLKIESIAEHYGGHSHHHHKKTDIYHHEKKTFSEGGDRDQAEGVIDIFQIYMQEKIVSPPFIETIKHKQKKQINQFQRYFEQNKELFSEISSVKNQSHQSHRSLFTFDNLLNHYFMLKNEEQPERQQLPKIMYISQQYAKAEIQEQERLDNLSVQKIKTVYSKLKDKYNALLKLSLKTQKQNKKTIKNIDKFYNDKLSKIRKQFNQCFKIICQRCTPHHFKKKTTISIDSQVQIQDFRLRKETSSVSDQSIKNDSSGDLAQQIYQGRQESKKVLKDNKNSTLIERLSIELQQVSKRFYDVDSQNLNLRKHNELLRKDLQKMIEVVNQKNKAMQTTIQKGKQDLSEFISLLVKTQQKNSQKQISSNKNAFVRKISSEISKSQILIATKVDQSEIIGSNLKNLFFQQLSISDKTGWANASQTKLKELVKSAFQVYRKKIYEQIVSFIKSEITELNKCQDEQCWYYIEQLRQQTQGLFRGDDNVNILFGLVHEFLSKIKADKENYQDVANLSVNSKGDQSAKKKQQVQLTNQQIKDLKNKYQLLQGNFQAVIDQNQSICDKLKQHEIMASQQKKLINKLKKQIDFITNNHPSINTVKQKEKELQEYMKKVDSIKIEKEKELQEVMKQVDSLKTKLNKNKKKTGVLIYVQD